MKRIFLLAVFALAFSLNLGAQDTTAVKDLSLVDSSLVNTSVFSLLSSDILSPQKSHATETAKSTIKLAKIIIDPVFFFTFSLLD